MHIFKTFSKIYQIVLKDHHQPVAIKKVEDFSLTPVSYEQRVINENWTFNTKPRDAETGNEVLADNRFVYKYLLLERKLSGYKGMDLWQYVAHFVNHRKFTKILSIGSGPCAVEMEIAKKLTADYSIDCIDLNADLIQRATQKARQQGFHLNPIVGDINELNFNQEYDLIIAVASLHHFVALEEIFTSINRALKADGEFVTYEPVCRSGMFLFRRQRIFLALVFALLPKKYRVNHQDFPGETRLDKVYREYDRSGWTFECIRSGDIPGLLRKHFRIKHWGRGMTFLRRVSDSIYGSNYDWSSPFDRNLAQLLCLADRFMRFFHLLPIEGLFFIGNKKSD